MLTSGGWDPKSFGQSPIMQEYLNLKNEAQKSIVKAKAFLQQAPQSYEIMRDNMSQDPEFNTPERFIAFSDQHISRLKAIIEIHGWPNFDTESAYGAWYIAQQATHDTKFQEEALTYLDELLKNPEEATKTNLRTQFAYLFDLVQINKGLSQFYGTACDENGYIKPIEDYLPHEQFHDEMLEAINKRRAEMGLETLQEYKTHLDRVFAQKRYTSDLKAALLS